MARAIGFHVGLSLGGTHQSEPVGLGVLPRVTENIAVLHPRTHHTEPVLIHPSPVERENVGVV